MGLLYLLLINNNNNNNLIRNANPTLIYVRERVWFPCTTHTYSGADKSLARPGRKQATATEDFEFHIPYL